MDNQRFFTAKQKAAIFNRDGGCTQCGADGTEMGPDGKPNGLEADHIVPWIKGGLTTLDNAATLCRIHNNQKGSKDQNDVRVDYHFESHFKTGTRLKRT